jgi:mRNA degradation ribonuclease J1/J2
VTNRTAIKAELMKKAETVIDELLDWHEETERPNLGQVEEKVLELRQRLSEEMAVTVLAHQAAVRPVPGPKCDCCGQEMRYKDMKEKTVTSWVGALTLERGYYYCDRCRTGLFPPG